MDFKFKKIINRIFLALGFFLMFIGSVFKLTIGKFVGVLMNPMLATFSQQNFSKVLLVMAAIISTYSIFINNYMLDWVDKNRIKMLQNIKIKHQDMMRDAHLSNNTLYGMSEEQLSENIKLRKLKEQYIFLMEEEAEIAKLQLKPLAYVSLISLSLFYWVDYYIKYVESISMVFPFLGRHLLISKAWFLPYWLVWYVICSFGISQFIKKILNKDAVE